MQKISSYSVRENWIMVLIALQPMLDVLAYWTRNAQATAAGYIRLAFMIAIPAVLLVTLRDPKEKKRLFAALAVVGIFCLLHILNGFRLGYRNFFSDVQYILRVVQTPVLAFSFIAVLRSEGSCDSVNRQAKRGMQLAFAFYIAALLVSLATGTWNSTYGGGIGISGWVIDNNRCANSIILVTMCCFLMYTAAASGKIIFQILCPAAVAVLLLTNGTKACYFAALGLLAAYAAFELFKCFILKKGIKPVLLAVTVVLFITSVLVYPITPRAREDALENGTGNKVCDEFRADLVARGYDIDAMTLEEKLNDPVLVDLFTTYYYKMIYAGVPALLDQYDITRVLTAYNMTTDPATLINVRLMKRTYARFVFEDSDTLTKIVGFEFDNIGWTDRNDLENDWPAIFYYYGYLGFALYCAMILYILALVLKKLLMDFRDSFTPLNFSLFVCLILQLVLAQMSGAILRRPNVSIYLSLVLALLYGAAKLTGPTEKRRLP